ncbi:TetR family transcriptional regulator [Sphaerotilus sp.]|uniref:TetR family transcriptional regulator n=1 Tax=Sphaerotilus sp. TaxID=2093942 RepID=UPI0025F2411B|nr:TetR family transcriptional regulator [Sphaerotilus sp.]
MVRRTKEEAAATREHLLDMAEVVFLREGVARTSLQSIAAEAGLTRGALYWHFRDKAELFNAMVERVRLPCEAATDALEHGDQPGGADPVETLRAFAWGPIARMLEDERTRRVFTIAIHRTEYSDEMRPALERHTAVMEAFRARAERLVVAGQARGVFDAGVQARAVSIGFMALIDGMLRRATLGPVGAGDVEGYRGGIEVFLRGVRRNFFTDQAEV